MTREESDHRVATIARLLALGAGIAIGVLLVRSLPDLVRYVKMERM